MLDNCSPFKEFTQPRLYPFQENAIYQLGHNYIGTEHLLLGLPDRSVASATSDSLLARPVGRKGQPA